MSATHTWVCFLLWIGFAAQDKTPEVLVTCHVSEQCALPCSFQPGSEETVEWFKQDEAVYRFQRTDGDGGNREHLRQERLAGRASVSPRQVSGGNATLILRRCGLKDRGAYRCHVQTSEGEHDAKVILKVEAPIQGLFLELSRLTGFEEMKCSVHNVFPAPRVTWATDPPTFEDLRPVTRILADKQGLYTVDSRLKRLKGRPDLVYICKMASGYDGSAWTSYLREREIRGSQGKDLTLPCRAPPHLNNPSLRWTFSNGTDYLPIVSYDSRSKHSMSTPPWDNHVEVDTYGISLGDGSLRLMDPRRSEHTGSYTCEFFVPYSTYTERSKLTIDGVDVQRTSSESSPPWWIIGVVLGVLALALVGLLAYLKLKGRSRKPRSDPEEQTELNRVKDAETRGQ